MDILALLQPTESILPKTTLHQMSRIVTAMLAMTGRVTMLGISRWAGAGGSYRTIQRFFHTAIPWADILSGKCSGTACFRKVGSTSWQAISAW